MIMVLDYPFPINQFPSYFINPKIFFMKDKSCNSTYNLLYCRFVIATNYFLILIRLRILSTNYLL